MNSLTDEEIQQLTDEVSKSSLGLNHPKPSPLWGKAFKYYNDHNDHVLTMGCRICYPKVVHFIIKNKTMNHELRRAQEQRLKALENAYKTIDEFATPSLDPVQFAQYESQKQLLLDRYKVSEVEGA